MDLSLTINNSIIDNDEEIIEAFMSTDDRSESDEEEVLNYVTNIQRKQRRICIQDYDKVIDKYSGRTFMQHFRFSRVVVQQLAEKYQTSCIHQTLIKNHNSRAHTISPEKTILTFPWYAGHQTASFRDVADRFNVCLGTLHDIIARVSEFLVTIAADVIVWPSDMEPSKKYFREIKGFPNVVGCIDSTHVKIDKPAQQQQDYCNRKNYHSVILQGVCNEKRKFISIFIGFPGSAHDARVFKNSSVYEKINTTGNDFYILGDSAYPLLPKLMTPYRDNGHLTQAQKKFNQRLSSSRVHIEHTFGLLKQRFRQLYHCKLRGHERICKFIKACCVLHNIGSEEDFSAFNGETSLPEEMPEEQTPVAANNRAATWIRNQLCSELCGTNQTS